MTKRVTPDVELYHTCKYGTLEEVKNIVETYGSHWIHVPNADGKVAIHGAFMRSGKEEMIQYLLDNGARVKVFTENDKTPLIIAIEKSYPSYVKIYLKNNTGSFTEYNDAFYLACIYRKETLEADIEIVRLFLQDGDVDLRKGFNRVCFSSELAMVKCFFDTLDASKMNSLLHPVENMETPLMYAAQNKQFGHDIIPFLIARGASATAVYTDNDNQRMTAYSFAYKSGLLNCLSALPPLNETDPYIVKYYPATSHASPIGLRCAIFPTVRLFSDFNTYASYVKQNTTTPMFRWHFLRTIHGIPAPDKLPANFPSSDYLYYLREYATRLSDNVLHMAASTSLAAVQQVLPLWLNPLIPNASGELPVDLAATPAIRAALQKYATWDASVPQKTWWFGPYFQQRARAFLLVCKRLCPTLPWQVQHIVCAYIAKAESVFVYKPKEKR